MSYLQEKLSVVRYVAAGSGVRLRSEYYQGGRMLFGPQVYAVLGRHDLVETWERRVAVNVGFGVGGAALALGGLAMTSSGGSDRTSTAVGFALTFVGMSCVAVPFFKASPARARTSLVSAPRRGATPARGGAGHAAPPRVPVRTDDRGGL